MSEIFWTQIETKEINEQNIDNNLNKLNEKSDKTLEKKEVELILNKINKNNPDKNIQITQNPDNNKYYLIINWNINPKWLTFEELKNKFPISPTDIPEIKNAIQ
jgi:hypothetical protein